MRIGAAAALSTSVAAVCERPYTRVRAYDRRKQPRVPEAFGGAYLQSSGKASPLLPYSGRNSNVRAQVAWGSLAKFWFSPALDVCGASALWPSLRFRIQAGH